MDTTIEIMNGDNHVITIGITDDSLCVILRNGDKVHHVISQEHYNSILKNAEECGYDIFKYDF